jgi:hypothetical protein
LPDLKDNAAIQFSKAVEKVQRELVNQILDLKKQGYTKDEMLLILQAIDMEDMILNRLNLNADIDKLMLSYERVLAGMEMTGAVSNESLTALLRMDRAKFAAEAGIMGNTIRTEVARGILAGASEASIAEGILKGSGGVLRADQAQTLANTALNTFERNVTLEMAELDPPDATYVYQGPVDDKTRNICLDMSSAGSLTREQIETQYPGAFGDGGGFNCRHRWARETSVSKKLTATKKEIQTQQIQRG